MFYMHTSSHKIRRPLITLLICFILAAIPGSNFALDEHVKINQITTANTAAVTTTSEVIAESATEPKSIDAADSTPTIHEKSDTPSLFEDIKVSESERIAISKLITKPQLALQRHLYIEALAAINQKKFKRYNALKSRLEGYPLLAHLEYKYLLKNTAKITGDTLQKFSTEHQSKR